MSNIKFKVIKGGKVIAVGAMVAGGMSAGSAFAAGTDFSPILTGLDPSTAITAIIGAGALLAGVGFARWATKKVARFFG